MTITQSQAESLLAQVFDLQAALIHRGELPRTGAHDVVEGYFTVLGTTVVHCACGEWIDRPDEESQLAYVLHVADALGFKVRLGRAA